MVTFLLSYRYAPLHVPQYIPEYPPPQFADRAMCRKRLSSCTLKNLIVIHFIDT